MDEAVDVTEQPWRAIEHANNIALTVAWQWSIAVHAQAARVRTGSGVGRLPDAYLLILAVRNVRRAAAMARRSVQTDKARAQVDEAITRFDEELPGVTAVRDVLEHFDEYSQGRGNLQQPGLKLNRREPGEELAARYSINFEYVEPNSGALRITVGGHSVELQKSSRAASGLVHALRSAIATEQAGR